MRFDAEAVQADNRREKDKHRTVTLTKGRPYTHVDRRTLHYSSSISIEHRGKSSRVARLELGPGWAVIAFK